MDIPEGNKIVLLNVFNTITHIFIGSVTSVACIYGYNTTASDHFRQHIILCTVGYVLLMSEAILAFNSNNGWSLTLHHSQKKMSHLVIQVAGSSLAIAGSIIRINGYPGQHFSTLHGIFGWLALILTFVSLIGGVLNMYISQRGKLIKICHSLVGCSTILFGMICLCIGFDKTPFRLWAGDAGAVTVIVSTTIIMLSIAISVLPTLIKRIRN